MSITATQMNSQLWCAVVGSPIRIPTVNSYVYYFPQGHLENAFIANYDGIHPNPMMLCRLVSLDFFVCPYSDEPFLKFRLKPISSSEKPNPAENNEIENEIEQIDTLNSLSKVLTLSDTKDGGSITVPKQCAEAIFPPLNHLDKPPQQNLSMKDVHNNVWDFNHIYRGDPPRHLLRKGWTKFVTKNRVVVGDSLVFIKRTRKEGRRITEELFMGIRRNDRLAAFKDVDDANVVKRRALAAIGNAARGRVFEVDYYPMAGSLPAFVVSADRVDASVGIQWATGMRVNLTRMTSCEGRIVAVNSQISHQWPQSHWRKLQVSWRDLRMSINMSHVSPWEVQCIPPSSTSSSSALLSNLPTYKKPKLNDGAGPSSSLLKESHPSPMESLPSLHCASFSATDNGFSASLTKLHTIDKDDQTDIISTAVNIERSNPNRASNEGQSRFNIAMRRDPVVTSIRLFGKDINVTESNVSENVSSNSSHNNMAWLRKTRKGKNVSYEYQ